MTPDQINFLCTAAAEVHQYQCLLAEVPSPCPFCLCCTGHFPCNSDTLCAEALNVVSVEMRRQLSFVIFYEPVTLRSTSGSCPLPYAALKPKVVSFSTQKPVNLLDPTDLSMQQGVWVDNSFQIYIY